MNDITNTDFCDQHVDITASLEAARRMPASAASTLFYHDLTEDSLATAFTEQRRDTLKFCHSSGRWYEWNGCYWVKHEGNHAIHLVRVFVRYQTGGLKEFCKATKIKAIETLLRESPDHAVDFSHWDRGPFLLGTPNGVVDLRTGRLLKPTPSWAITKRTSVVPVAGTPTVWLKFLHDATNGSTQMIRYIQQICGYCLTGSTQEHALFFVYGPGGNGKSVFLNTVAGITGDYARVSSMETFTASKNDRHPTELAMLQGARLVTASETEEGRSWAEAKVKQLTGSDPISARFMRQDFFEFTPQFKLIVVGNHAPQLKAVDDAIKRRFNILPFTFKPQSPDRQLEAKLRKEGPQILNWMIEGCLDWLKHGLVRPDVVTEATAEYFEEQDVFGQWIRDCCEVTSVGREQPTTLFNDWARYARERSEEAGNMKSFAAALHRHGFRKGSSGGIRWWFGLQRRYQSSAE